MLDIIIVEDNKEIGRLLSDFFTNEKYTVSVAETGERAVELFEKYGARLVILDITLPGIDGFAVCRRIRENSNAHIMIASARTDKDDMLKGLGLGADDYIEKPYDIDILLAKVRGVFRRRFAYDELVSDDIRINSAACTVYVGDRQIQTTAKEFELLKFMMENKGTTLKKEYLFNTIWGSDSDSEIQTLTVHIKWLRQKLETDPKNPKHIITEWGIDLSKFKKISCIFILAEILVLILCNILIMRSYDSEDLGGYRVDISRVKSQIEAGKDLENIDLTDYPTIISVKKFNSDETSKYDYAVESINGELYRFEYQKKRA